MNRRLVIGLVVLGALSACGSRGAPPPPPGPLAPPAPTGVLTGLTSIVLQSDAGDGIGAGRDYRFTQADALVSVSAMGGRLSVDVTGDTTWSGHFQEPSELTTLVAGGYGGLTRYPFHDPAVGGLDWSGNGLGCNTLTGWFTVDAVAYDGPALVAIDLRFEQHCDDELAALHGEVHWAASDPTAPPGPTPPPPGLWDPGAITTGASYVYLQSEVGDWIGAGRTLAYTSADATLTVTSGAGGIAVAVNGDERWYGRFGAMTSVATLEPGYYGSITGYPFVNPARGGLEWAGDGRACNTLSGWFVVDGATWSGTFVQSIDLRFEQHCDAAAPALRGKLHWAP